MNLPDYDEAMRVVRSRLENGLPAELRYHSIAHTFEEVLPAVERIAEMEDVTGEDLLLLRTAALYHDLGFVEQSEDHESVSARIAEEGLPQFGYNGIQIQTIKTLILATKPPTSPTNRLEEILLDADLAILGQDNYLTRTLELRDELAAQGDPYDNLEWYSRQLEFLKAHTYWSRSAKALWEKGKQENISQLIELIELG